MAFVFSFMNFEDRCPPVKVRRPRRGHSPTESPTDSSTDSITNSRFRFSFRVFLDCGRISRQTARCQQRAGLTLTMDRSHGCSSSQSTKSIKGIKGPAGHVATTTSLTKPTTRAESRRGTDANDVFCHPWVATMTDWLNTRLKAIANICQCKQRP